MTNFGRSIPHDGGEMPEVLAGKNIWISVNGKWSGLRMMQQGPADHFSARNWGDVTAYKVELTYEDMVEIVKIWFHINSSDSYGAKNDECSDLLHNLGIERE